MDPAKAAKVMGGIYYSENSLKKFAIKIFERMNPDKAAAILGEMLDTRTNAGYILAQMDVSKAASILNSSNLDVITCVNIVKGIKHINPKFALETNMLFQPIIAKVFIENFGETKKCTQIF